MFEIFQLFSPVKNEVVRLEEMGASLSEREKGSCRRRLHVTELESGCHWRRKCSCLLLGRIVGYVSGAFWAVPQRRWVRAATVKTPIRSTIGTRMTKSHTTQALWHDISPSQRLNWLWKYHRSIGWSHWQIHSVHSGYRNVKCRPSTGWTNVRSCFRRAWRWYSYEVEI